MFDRLNQRDAEFIDSCLDSSKRYDLMQQWHSLRVQFTLTGLLILTVIAISMAASWSFEINTVFLFALIVSLNASSMATHNLRLAQLVDRLIPPNEPG